VCFERVPHHRKKGNDRGIGERVRATFDSAGILSIVKIFPKFSFFHSLCERPVSRCDHTSIDPYRPCAAQTFKLALLKDAQRFRLQFEGKLTDFIEKER